LLKKKQHRFYFLRKVAFSKPPLYLTSGFNETKTAILFSGPASYRIGN
jgi:hypothetical protein